MHKYFGNFTDCLFEKSVINTAIMDKMKEKNANLKAIGVNMSNLLSAE